MVKWLGAALVVICSTMLGMNAVLRSRQRIRSLSVLIEALQAMRDEIAGWQLPLPELLERLAARQRQPAAELFGGAALRLKKNGAGFSEAWEDALRETESLGLLPEELQALEQLGAVLGRTPAEEQTEAIGRALSRLALFLELEEKEHMMQSRVRAAVSAGAGVMLAILLL